MLLLCTKHQQAHAARQSLRASHTHSFQEVRTGGGTQTLENSTSPMEQQMIDNALNNLQRMTIFIITGDFSLSEAGCCHTCGISVSTKLHDLSTAQVELEPGCPQPHDPEQV